MKSLKKSGFTLLELLVVISIIAILAVSLTPAFSRAREAARRTTCGQAMGQVHKAITMYEVDYNSYPTTGTGGTLIYTDKPQDGLNLLYRQYIDDVRVFSCPSNPVGRPTGPGAAGTGWHDTATRNAEGWQYQPNQKMPFSYAFNSCASTWEPANDALAWGVGSQKIAATDAGLARPANTIMVA